MSEDTKKKAYEELAHFTVRRLFDEQHVEMTNPITLSDVTITVREPANRSFQKTVGFEVSVVPGDALSKEIKSLGGYDWPMSLADWWAGREISCSYHFRGCRNESQRAEKVDAAFQKVNKEYERIVADPENSPEVLKLLEGLNDRASNAAFKIGNMNFEQRVFRLLRGETLSPEYVDKVLVDDGIAAIRNQAKELQQQLDDLTKRRKALYQSERELLAAAMLKKLRNDGWTLNGVPITDELQKKVSETLERGRWGCERDPFGF